MEDDTYDTNYSSLLMGKSAGQRALYRNQDESVDSTAYKAYPNSRPFINDDYERPPYKPVSSYPEGNRRAVINALKKLQDKISKLEVERCAAEDNLKTLAQETNKYRDILQKEHSKTQPRQTTVSVQNQELESQLSAAETRCSLLEKQLEYMRKMVHSAEHDRDEALTKTVRIDLPEHPPAEPSPDFQSHLRKISELEREHIKLTANQSVAESKIRELEEKLGAEQDHRRQIVEKSAEMESASSANRILLEAEEDYSKPVIKPKRPLKKKKRTVVPKRSQVNGCSKPEAKHYRLNLADIPFVAGKNTGPSHSVGANVQRVFSLMKNHNMALCSRTGHNNACGSTDNGSSGSISPSTEQDLAEILLQLQDEFHQMSFEHQELSKEIGQARDVRIQEDLERELDALVSRMEAKSQQISKIRKHQEKMCDRRKKKKTKKPQDDALRPRSAISSREEMKVRSSPRHNGEVEVTTTIKTKGTGVMNVRPQSAREISLNVLKDMKKLQTTLRKDDLSWD